MFTKGQSKVETSSGFTGGECRDASKFIEQALGQLHRREADRRVLPWARRPTSGSSSRADSFFRSRPPPHFHLTFNHRKGEPHDAQRAFVRTRTRSVMKAGIWVQSFEHDDAFLGSRIARLCRQNSWSLATWDVDRGLSFAGQRPPKQPAWVNAADPLSAIKALNGLSSTDGTALLVLRNFHRFLGSAEIVQALDTAIAAGKQNRTFLVVCSRQWSRFPWELERQLRGS